MLTKVKKGFGKVLHLTRGRGKNTALCGAEPPFKVVKKGAVTCKKCKEAKSG